MSVRDACEAEAALRGGAAVIDVKEPDRGPLGMADVAAIADIVTLINGRAPVSAALGEVVEWIAAVDARSALLPALPPGLSFVKLGLAGLGARGDWCTMWLSVRMAFEQAAGRPLPWVAAAYADAGRADAPPLSDVIEAAARTACPGVLIDTWDKSRGGLFECLPEPELLRGLQRARRRGLFVALAGKLTAADLRRPALQSADVIGVRSAACTEENRRCGIAADRVAKLRLALAFGSSSLWLPH